MAARPTVAIVGAGNLGAALALALAKAGFEIEAIVTRPASERFAKKLAKQLGARATTSAAAVEAELIWFCVPDSEIVRCAQSLSRRLDWQGRTAFHSSGALTSDALSPLRECGAAVASVHPMMTFVRGSRPPFIGVPFAVEGDRSAVCLARRIVSDLGGTAHPIRTQDKAAYHAWGTFASPLFTALLATTEQVAGLAGVKKKEARRRIVPILLQTLANYAQFGAADGFSGPIIRGDLETVRKHLRVLRGAPQAREVYLALARSAVRLLPGKNKAALKRLLDSPSP